MNNLEPIDSDLAEHLSVERALAPVPDEVAARVKTAVLKTVAASSPSGTGGVGGGGALLTGVGVVCVIVGGALGFAFNQWLRVDDPHRTKMLESLRVPTDHEAEGERPTHTTVGRDMAADVATQVGPAPASPPTFRRQTHALPGSAGELQGARSDAPAPVDTRDAERAMLANAQAELRAGHGAAALETLHRYSGTFVPAHFEEERDALEVRALLHNNERDVAQAHARRFLERYPGSLFTPAVSAALQGAPQ